MTRPDDTATPSWDELVAREPLIGSEGTVGGLDLPPVDPALVGRLLAQVPDDEHHQGRDAVVRLRHAAQGELEPEVAADRARTGPAGPSGVVLAVLMVSAWLPTLGAMRQGFDGVTWTWTVVAGLLVSLGCAALLATPALMARPVAADWKRGTGFGLVAIASAVLLGSVLLRLSQGSTVEDVLVQFVLLVAVPVVALAAWLLLRDRTSSRAGPAERDTTDARAALAVELAALRRLYEAGRLTPDSARTGAAEAARHWGTR